MVRICKFSLYLGGYQGICPCYWGEQCEVHTAHTTTLSFAPCSVCQRPPKTAAVCAIHGAKTGTATRASGRYSANSAGLLWRFGCWAVFRERDAGAARRIQSESPRILRCAAQLAGGPI